VPQGYASGLIVANKIQYHKERDIVVFDDSLIHGAFYIPWDMYDGMGGCKKADSTDCSVFESAENCSLYHFVGASEEGSSSANNVIHVDAEVVDSNDTALGDDKYADYRLVLIVDLLRPSHLPRGTATGGHTAELDDFISRYR
jgi:hypothetical protein